MGKTNLISAFKEKFQVIETHISSILLTGEYAYKIKKPIDLGFVDFSTLEKRAFFCLEELRLNKVLAPELYLAVIPISGTPEHPEMNGSGIPIEFAIQMHQFEQECLLSNYIQKKPLTPNIIREMVRQITQFHANTPIANPESQFATEEKIWQPVVDNFITCKEPIGEMDIDWVEKIKTIEDWSIKTFKQNKLVFRKRKEDGYVRDCHGDLHLGNIIWQNSKVTIFDRIEFSEDLRIIDVINEIAFLTMDLKAKNHFKEAFLFLNDYLHITGDFEGVILLRFYEVYRAMVRSKIAFILDDKKSGELYIDLAIKIMQHSKPKLIITQGLPGSGKSSLADQLAPLISAIHISSDIERKRLFKKMDKRDLYTEENIDLIYKRLIYLAELILSSGHSVIVDATFLKHKHRECFSHLAKQLNNSFTILRCNTSIKVLRKRVARRHLSSLSSSDADLSALNQLMNKEEPLTPSELNSTLEIQMDTPFDILKLARNNIFGQ